MNAHDKIVTDNLNYCVDHWVILTGWEKGFIANVQNIPPENFSPKRFSTLQDIVASVKQRVFKEMSG